MDIVNQEMEFVNFTGKRKRNRKKNPNNKREQLIQLLTKARGATVSFDVIRRELDLSDGWLRVILARARDELPPGLEIVTVKYHGLALREREAEGE